MIDHNDHAPTAFERWFITALAWLGVVMIWVGGAGLALSVLALMGFGVDPVIDLIAGWLL